MTLPVLLAGYTFSNLDQSLFSFAIPGLLAEFHTDLTAIGWILSASFALAAVVTVAIGLLSDRYGRRIAFVVTLGASAFFVGLHALMPTLLALGVVRIVGFGISNGMVPIVLTYAAEIAPPRFRGLVAGLLSLGYPIGGMLAGLIAAALLTAHGWRAVFVPAFAIVPVAVLLAWLLPPDRHAAVMLERATPAPWPTRLRGLFAPGRRRTSLAGMAANFLFGGAYAGTFFYFPSFLHATRGLSPAEAARTMGIALGVGSAGYIAAALCGDLVMSRRDAAATWMLLGAAALLGVVWGPTGSGATLAMMCAMTFFFYGTNGVLGAYLPEMFPAHLRAAGVAVVGSLAMYGGFACFPPLIAHCIEAIGWNAAFSIAAVPLFVAGLALFCAQARPAGFAEDQDCDGERAA